ncbi:hypothetical protein JG688_00011499 [Phytophthora aleatoria]|uniref:Uncharacterized protein n=1 Tax=Phytophthora aleatoria TaxID=2496075 RepID=A0A8J5MF28_9STRA|nr:hypothetical protein JG688_00011499 [Phytophthora aleatoria]
MGPVGKSCVQGYVRVANAHVSSDAARHMTPPEKWRHASTSLASHGMGARMLAGISPVRNGSACSSSTRCTWRGGDATAGVVLARDGWQQ